MPIYIYNCENCCEDFKVSHSMTETVENCEICGVSGSLKRIPSLFFNFKHKANEKKTGSYVKDFIKDSKEELREQKNNLQEGVKDA